MAVYTSAFTGEEIDEILASVGTVADTQAALNTTCGTIITKLNTIIAAQTDMITAITNGNTALDPDPVETIYNSSVSASTTISNIAAIDTSLVKKLWVFCDQTASTSLTIQILSQATSDATNGTLFYPMTLNETTLNGSCYFVDNLPPYIKFKIINSDPTHATTVTIKIQKTR